MISAQRSAEDIVSKARDEAAAVSARRRGQGQGDHPQRADPEAEGPKRARAHQAGRGGVPRQVQAACSRSTSQASAEITLPDDVNLLMGETDEGVVGEVEIEPPTPVVVDPVPSLPIAAVLPHPSSSPAIGEPRPRRAARVRIRPGCRRSARPRRLRSTRVSRN